MVTIDGVQSLAKIVYRAFSGDLSAAAAARGGRA